MKSLLMFCGVWVGIAVGGFLVAIWPREPSAPPPVALPAPDTFSPAKKNFQIQWCESRHGVAVMTFEQNHSNVVCVQQAAVIPLPGDEQKGAP